MTTAAPATRPAHAPRMLERYRKEIAPGLVKDFKHKNAMAAAHLQKIVVNMGCGEAAHDAKVLEAAQKDLGLITGQRPLITRAKKAISNFKIREHDPVGCKVTLRRARMYEFLDRLVSIALPRIREVSVHIATAVAECAYKNGLAGKPKPDDVAADVRSQMFDPNY